MGAHITYNGALEAKPSRHNRSSNNAGPKSLFAIHPELHPAGCSLMVELAGQGTDNAALFDVPSLGDYVDAPNRVFPADGSSSIELGRYGPFLPSDRSNVTHWEVKNFVFTNERKSYCVILVSCPLCPVQYSFFLLVSQLVSGLSMLFEVLTKWSPFTIQRLSYRRLAKSSI